MTKVYTKHTIDLIPAHVLHMSLMFYIGQTENKGKTRTHTLNFSPYTNKSRFPDCALRPTQRPTGTVRNYVTDWKQLTCGVTACVFHRCLS